MHDNLGSFLTKRAYLTPQREAYVDSQTGERLTFRDLNARANQLANRLRDSGLAKGERVGLLLMNSVEFMEAYFALAKIGAVVVPLNWRLVPDELEFILKDSGTKRLIFGHEFVGAVGELHSRSSRTPITHWLHVRDIKGPSVPLHFAEDYADYRSAGDPTEPEPGANGDDMLYIMYTSGTTGLPKGVVHSHNTAMWAVFTIGANAEFHDGDRYLAALPMFHVGALTPLAVTVYRGATSIVMRMFDPKLAWELIDRERITTGLAVPAMLNFMLQVPEFNRYQFQQLRWMMTGAAPVPVQLMQRYFDLGVQILQVYGLTESCGPACLMDAEHALTKVGSTGKSFFHTEVKLIDEAGNTCAPGVAGEVLVRGPHVMIEYWNRPEATAETLKGGWLHTGDVAIMDDEGFVYIQDRIKDMVISGGENVYPAEIEAVLMTHPDIIEAGVIGQPSAKWGESPFAVVVRRRPDLAETEILEFCRGRMAAYKQPKGVAFVDVIPRNPSGKILKRILREQFPGPASV